MRCQSTCVLIAIVASMCRGNEVRAWGDGVAEPPPASQPASQQPRSRQYYLPPREGDNLIDARATLGLVVGIAPSSSRERQRALPGDNARRCNSSANPQGIAITKTNGESEALIYRNDTITYLRFSHRWLDRIDLQSKDPFI